MPFVFRILEIRYYKTCSEIQKNPLTALFDKAMVGKAAIVKLRVRTRKYKPQEGKAIASALPSCCLYFRDPPLYLFYIRKECAFQQLREYIHN
jgi:hypothetical protein